MSTPAFVMQQRVRHQGLRHPTAATPGDAVRDLVAVQAQEFAYALWGVSQHVVGRPDRAAMLQAFDNGELLRTHVLRPTWHFVAPGDLRWLLRLTAPRLRRQMAYQDRRVGLDDAELRRSNAVLAGAVEGGRHRTRQELTEALEAAGIPAGGGRLVFILIHAEYDEVLVSGAMRGKQHTYAAFDERVPPGPDYDEDGALAELVRRFVATRAPVTAKDLATWASLTLGQARRGFAAIESDCFIEELDGLTMWSPAAPILGTVAPQREPTIVDMLQGYDELIMSYSESRLMLAPSGVLPVGDSPFHLHVLLIDGALAGHWRHQLTGSGAVIEIQLRRPLSAAERTALERAVSRYGDYLGVPTVMAEPVLMA